MKPEGPKVSSPPSVLNALRWCAIVLFPLLLILVSAGCSHRAAAIPLPAAGVPEGPVMSDSYVLQPGDVVEIKFLHNPELNETATIRPDGRISLQMIDDIRAAGLTPAQLDDLLTQRYGLLVSKAMITVMVRTFATDRVYVGGEVRHPQTLALKGRMNALQAVFAAGGFREDARLSRVVILSRGPDNLPVAREVNLNKAMEGELDFEDYRLRPCDIVYVPKTCLASTAHFMSNIYRLIPAQVFFGFTYEVNDASPDTD